MMPIVDDWLQMSPIVFLDFDGVLRRVCAAPAVFEQDCLGRFEQTVRSARRVRVVIASNWRLEMPLQTIRSRFSPDVQPMIVGATPEAARLTGHYRYREVLEYLEREPFAGVRWIAVDDEPAHFPSEAEVLLTDSNRGSTNERRRGSACGCARPALATSGCGRRR